MTDDTLVERLANAVDPFLHGRIISEAEWRGLRNDAIAAILSAIDAAGYVVVEKPVAKLSPEDLVERLAKSMGKPTIDDEWGEYPPFRAYARACLAEIAAAGRVVVDPKAILAVIAARKAMYEGKAADRDPLGDDCANLHDLSEHSAEAMEYLETEMSAMLSASRKV